MKKNKFETACQPLVEEHSKLTQNMAARLTAVEKMDDLVEQFFAIKALRQEWRDLSEKVTSDLGKTGTDIANKSFDTVSVWLAGGIVGLTAVAGLVSGGAAAFATFALAGLFGSMVGIALEPSHEKMPKHQLSALEAHHCEKVGMMSLVTQLDKAYVENVEKAGMALAQSPRFTEAYDDANPYEKSVLSKAFAQVAQQARSTKPASPKPPAPPHSGGGFKL